MNNDRRKQITKAQVAFEAAQAALAIVMEDFADVKDSLEGIRDDEQEYFDNMPESLQGGDKGQNAEQAISQLDDAVNDMESVDFEDLISKLEEAKA